MAGNFWESSHFQQWLLDRQDLLRSRQADLKVLAEDEYSKIMIFFANFIQALGEQLKVRQQVIATATVYFKRFYARNSLKSIDPLLMAPTCVFLASKVEEFGVISNNRFITTCTQVVKKFQYVWSQDFPYRIQNILECEFYLLEMMDCCLILYHPYRPLTQYAADITSEESLLQLSWRIVNDTLRTDIPLMYPPYMIALACLHMACVIQQLDAKQWFAELAVDMDKILEITKAILALYEMWKIYDEKKEIAGLLTKMPKPKTAPSRPPSQGAPGEDSSANQLPPSFLPESQLQAAHQAANQIVRQTANQNAQSSANGMPAIPAPVSNSLFGGSKNFLSHPHHARQLATNGGPPNTQVPSSSAFQSLLHL